ncbi:MAG: hypothetical protein V4688_00040 [Pseudomonadota bacterium]
MSFRLFGVILLSACTLQAFASEYDVEIAILKKKSGLCLESIKVQSCGSTEFCNDHGRYTDYLFKGSAKTWATYHLENNDINDGNINEYLAAMKASTAATTQSMQAPKCEK